MSLPAAKQNPTPEETSLRAGETRESTRDRAPGAVVEPMDAAARLSHLRKALANQPLEDAKSEDSRSRSKVLENWRGRLLPAGDKAAEPQAKPKSKALETWRRRLFKTVFGLAVIAAIGYEPLRNYFLASSVEAVVNAQTITLRSPIDGVVGVAPSLQSLGSNLVSGVAAITIADPDADPSHLNALTSQLEQAESDARSVAARLGNGRQQLATLRAQTQAFTDGRLRQLTARREQLAAEAGAAAKKTEGAKETAQRLKKLAATGAATDVQLTQAVRDADIAAFNEISANKQVEAASVEIDGLRRGVFIGDSYNDQPQSAQRATDIEREVADLESASADRDSRVARLKAEQEAEQTRYARLSAAAVSAPAPARLFEILVAPGERVHKGQELVRALDCQGAVVSAVVGEAVYNKLRIGASARFLPRDGGATLSGRVIGLTGASPAAANFAILPSYLVGEAYHVTIDVPDLRRAEACAVGRTGRVLFNPGESAAADRS